MLLYVQYTTQAALFSKIPTSDLTVGVTIVHGYGVRGQNLPLGLGVRWYRQSFMRFYVFAFDAMI